MLCALALLNLVGWYRLEAQVLVKSIHSFGFPAIATTKPYGGLVQGNDQMLYGTTEFGGDYDNGTLYRLRVDGTNFEILHHFGEGPEDGRRPLNVCIVASDGRLYGVTWRGGGADSGVAWSWDRVDGSYRILRSFYSDPTDAKSPNSLLEGEDGALYGTSDTGGTDFAGTLFRLNKDGSDYSILRHFRRQNTDARSPGGKLVRGKDGRFYGTTYDGGSFGRGTIYRVRSDGTDFVLLHSFGETPGDSLNPVGGLTQDANGVLYGTAGQTVFRINSDGSDYRILHTFLDNPDGSLSQGYLQVLSDNTLWGTTVFGGTAGFGTLFALRTDGTDYRVVHSFTGTNGDKPIPGLAVASDGLLYGITWGGGFSGDGTVFRLDPVAGKSEPIWHFNSVGGDGRVGIGGIAEAEDGTLYGTCSAGGQFGGGIAFTVGGLGENYSIVRHFSAANGGGIEPSGPPTKGPSNLMYGLTQSGGSNGVGTLYRLSPESGISLLHHFSSADGTQPMGRLALDSQGRLFGTTARGGSAQRGTVFRFEPASGQYQVIHHFKSGLAEGRTPVAGLTLGTNGYYLGTTQLGGSNDLGTLFRISPAGDDYSVLRHFGTGLGDGRRPTGELLSIGTGTLYGTTLDGGATNRGTLFRINLDGSEYTILHHFGLTASDGRNPVGALASGPDGWIYGATQNGGKEGYGSIYCIRKDGTGYTLLTSMSGTAPALGLNPSAGIVRGSNGALYGLFSGGGLRGAGALTQIPLWLGMTSTDQVNSNLTTTTVESVIGGMPILSYQWRRDGVSLEGETNAALILKNLTRAMNGTYSIKAVTAAGSLLSSNLVIRHRSPQVLQILSRDERAIQVRSVDSDGGMISAFDVRNFRLLGSVGIRKTWTIVNSPLTLVDGGLNFEIPLDAEVPTFFWRLEER